MIDKKDKIKNPYLNPDGSFNLIDKFVGIDYIKYEEKNPKKEDKKTLKFSPKIDRNLP